MANLTQFKALLVPPTTIARPDLAGFRPDGVTPVNHVDAADLVWKKANACIVAGTETSPELVAAQATLAHDLTAVTNASQASADQWLDDVFAAFERATEPAVPNTLYIILTSEFALNGPGGNANHPIPEALETYVRNQIYTRLLTHYPLLHVLFAFSCCSFGTDLQKVVEDRGPNRAAVTHYKLHCANRITIEASSAARLVKQVAKVKKGDFDGWPSTTQVGGGALFHLPNLRVHPHAPETEPNRLDEIRLDLSCFGNANHALAFGTCFDIESDPKHGNVSLVVIAGGEAPLRNLVDKAHPMLFNDVKSWSNNVAEATLYGAGYYSYEKAKALPADYLNVGERVHAADVAKNQGDHPVQDVANRFYWHSGKIDAAHHTVAVSHGEVQFDYAFKATVAIQLPPHTEPDSGCYCTIL